MLTKPTLDFLLEIVQKLTDKQGETETTTPFSQAIHEKYIKTKKINTNNQVQVIEFEEDFIEALFMKFKIKVPQKAVLDQLKLLLTIKFGTKAKECYILITKLERVLHDLGYIYYNIIKILR